MAYESEPEHRQSFPSWSSCLGFRIGFCLLPGDLEGGWVQSQEYCLIREATLSREFFFVPASQIFGHVCYNQAYMGVASGFSQAVLTWLVQVRMQSEGKLKEGVPKKYPNAFKAYGIIARSADIICTPQEKTLERSRVQARFALQ
jgi:hypothetical protein